MAEMRIFVSHSSQDQAFTRSMVQALRDSGADVWYDQHDLGLGHLREAISRELSGRDTFIVVLSKAALASQWVRDECNWAYDLYQQHHIIRYVPVLAEPLTERDFDAMLFLSSLKRVEASGHQSYSPGEAIALVLRLLGLRPTTPPHERMQAVAIATLQAMEDFTASLQVAKDVLARQKAASEMDLQAMEMLVHRLQEATYILHDKLNSADRKADPDEMVYGMQALQDLASTAALTLGRGSQS